MGSTAGICGRIGHRPGHELNYKFLAGHAYVLDQSKHRTVHEECEESDEHYPSKDLVANA
ncbi:hypothetical protein F9L00_09015 [Brucella anthropi]|nr:hypothetical protein F9L00_09015 [Brucella anthropi]